MSTYAFYATLTFFLVLCVFFALLILIQKGRGGGISSAFGGSGGNTAFGSKTGDVLTWATAVVFAIFLTSAVALNLLANRVDNEYQHGVQAEVAQPSGTDLAVPSAAPVATPTNGNPTNATPANGGTGNGQPTNGGQAGTPTTSPAMSIVPVQDRSPGGISEPGERQPTTTPTH